jgi:hypothetical protein
MMARIQGQFLPDYKPRQKRLFYTIPEPDTGKTQNDSRLGSANPLQDRKLEELHEEGVLKSIYDGVWGKHRFFADGGIPLSDVNPIRKNGVPFISACPSTSFLR